MSIAARGAVMIDVEECKGCGLCVASCPPQCIALCPELSAYGVHPAHYTGKGCTGCGICFYCCPEPGAITVYRLRAIATQAAAVSSQPSACSGQPSASPPAIRLPREHEWATLLSAPQQNAEILAFIQENARRAS